MVRKLAAAPEPTELRDPPPDLRDAVDAAIASMPWAQGTDDAMVALAKRLAFEIMQAADRAQEYDALCAATSGDLLKRIERLEAHCNTTKLVGWLGPQLQGALKELGGTPQSRKAMSVTQPVGGALAAIRDSLPGAR